LSRVVRFLSGEGADGAGRTLAEVLTLDDAQLERRHDFIQWLFPLTEPSGAVPGSPVLTPEDIVAIRADPRAQAALAAGARRMGEFYARTDAWLAAHDHNHLRITRILRSLRLLAGDAAAEGFRHDILQRAAGAPINARTLEFWVEA